MINKKSSPSGIISLLLTALIWGLAFVAQRTASSSIESMAVNAFRFFLATFLLLIFCAILDYCLKKSGKKTIPWSNDTIIGGSILGIILFLGYNLQQYGMQLGTNAGKSAFITALYIIMVPLLCVLVRKRLTFLAKVAVLISIYGFYLISINDTMTIEFGDIVLLLCALIFAFHIVFTDIYSKDSDPVKLTLVQMMVGSVISIIAVSIIGVPTKKIIEDNLISLLYIGIASSGIGFTLQTYGQKKTETSLATLLMSLESVFALIFGTIILKEAITPKELLGCLLVFIGVFLAQIDFPKKFLQMNRYKYFIE